MRVEVTPTTRFHLTGWRERGALVLRGNFVVIKRPLSNKKTSPFLRRLEVHYPVNLSNSFIEDLEKVGKFYEKHKSYIKTKSKKSLEEV